mmetsp:Transcript_56275/g.125585  ORF Transcript_56275/g.125585 Transcript_56275/m.125585 type:complete len:201 (+) Transcript_56275:442-1044(+)
MQGADGACKAHGAYKSARGAHGAQGAQGAQLRFPITCNALASRPGGTGFALSNLTPRPRISAIPRTQLPSLTVPQSHGRNYLHYRNHLHYRSLTRQLFISSSLLSLTVWPDRPSFATFAASPAAPLRIASAAAFLMAMATTAQKFSAIVWSLPRKTDSPILSNLSFLLISCRQPRQTSSSGSSRSAPLSITGTQRIERVL